MIVCGIDCGFQGGISILSNEYDNPIIFKMPVIKEEKIFKGKKKIKRSYDLLELRRIFKNNLEKNSIIWLEKVSSMPGEGSVSSFNFGKGFGSIMGVIVGLFAHNPTLVSSQTWKKHFPELVTDKMKEIKSKIKELRVNGRILEDKASKKENKRQVDKLGREFKSLSKTEARNLASVRYPDIADLFKKKNSDGMAESLLIMLYGKKSNEAIYGRDNHDKLV